MMCAAWISPEHDCPSTQVREIWLQYAERQSVPSWHALASAHGEAPSELALAVPLAKKPPPQSMSVSLSFLMPSMCVAFWHVHICPMPQLTGAPPGLGAASGPGAQTRSTQSVPRTHAWPSAQAGAPSLPGLVPPPQSTPVSLSFFTPSFGAGGMHVQVWPVGQSMGLFVVLAVADVMVPV
jgi:hypothetical protein